MKISIQKITALVLLLPAVFIFSNKEILSTDTSDSSIFTPVKVKRTEKISRFESTINSYFTNTVGSRYVPGALLSIQFNNEPFYYLKKNMQEDSIVSVASVTKPFTAFAVMQLVEKGQISIDEKVSRYIPGFKITDSSETEITVKQLLYQISGIPYRARIGSTVIRSNNQYITVPTPLHPPGVHFEYSNYNYILLAKIIENVSGLTYSNYIQKNIFEPLNMNHSSAIRSTGAGGITSTAGDLIHFVNMLASQGNYKGRNLLSPHYFKMMFQKPDYVKETESMFFYGMGFRVIRSRGKLAAFYHTGIHNGTLTEIKIFPENGASLVHVANPPYHSSQAAQDYRWKMTAYYNSYVGMVYNPANVIPPDRLHPSPPANDELASYEGIYVNSGTSEKIKIVKKGKSLYRLNNNILEPMQPLSNIEFKSNNKYYPYQFVWSGEVLNGISTGGGFYKK